MITFQLTGRIVTDPELKTVGDTQVCNARVAVRAAGEKSNDKDNPGRQDGFFTLEAWGKQAEFMDKYMKKGSSIEAHGSVRYETWKDKDGDKNREKAKFVADNIGFPPKPPADHATGTDEAAPEAVGAAGAGQRQDPYDI